MRSQEQQRKKEREAEEQHARAQEQQRKAERERIEWTRKWITEAENWMRRSEIPHYEHRQGVDAVRRLLDSELSPEDQAQFTRSEVESVLAFTFASILKEKEDTRNRQELLNYAAAAARTGSSGYWGEDAERIREAANAAAQASVQNGELSSGRLAVDRAVRLVRGDLDDRKRQQEKEEMRLREEEDAERERLRLERQWEKIEEDLPYQVSRILPHGSPRTKEVALSEAAELLNKYREKGRSPCDFTDELRWLLREISYDIPDRVR